MPTIELEHSQPETTNCIILKFKIKCRDINAFIHHVLNVDAVWRFVSLYNVLRKTSFATFHSNVQFIVQRVIKATAELYSG